MENMASGIPAAQKLDFQNFDRMEDMDEDSRIAAQLQAEELMNAREEMEL